MFTYKQFCLLLEYNRSRALAGLGKRFTERVQHDPTAKGLTPEQVLAKLESGDPTQNHQYVNWLARAYQNGSELEDLLSRGHGALSKLETLKKKKLIRPEHSDIGRFKTLKSLEDALEGYELPEDETVDKGRYEELVDNSEVRAIIPHDKNASCYYGRGTRWCTAAKQHNMFDRYNKWGHLVILIPKKPQYHGEKYQLHFEGNQRGGFRNEKDETVLVSQIKRRFPSLNWNDLAVSAGVNPVSLRKSNISKVHDKIKQKIDDGTLTPQQALEYVEKTGVRDDVDFAKLEDIIAQDPYTALAYAHRIVKKRWPKGEKAILKNSGCIIEYAKNIAKDRWPKGEKALLESNNPHDIYYYTLNVIKGRWPEGEKVLLKRPSMILAYAMNVVGGRWPEGEKVILTNDDGSSSNYDVIRYVTNIIGERWPEAENLIAKNAWASLMYAKNIIKGPWPKGEKAIKSDKSVLKDYKSFLSGKLPS